MPTPIKATAYVVATDEDRSYYLMKVERRGNDVYCFTPRLGAHYSLHESGESHVRREGEGEELGIAMVGGEAGSVVGGHTVREPIAGVGRAICVVTQIYVIATMGDFGEFNRNTTARFQIDMTTFQPDITAIEVGVWAVPQRNKVSFEWNVPDVAQDRIHKVESVEPQIWIYAKPF